MQTFGASTIFGGSYFLGFCLTIGGFSGVLRLDEVAVGALGTLASTPFTSLKTKRRKDKEIE